MEYMVKMTLAAVFALVVVVGHHYLVQFYSRRR